MRILHAHKYFHDRDGAGRYLFALMRRQTAAGHQVAPFAMHDDRNVRTAWEKYFVSSLATDRAGFGQGALRQMERAWWSAESARKMTSLIKDFRPDVVHAHNVYTHLSPSVLVACARQDVPVVMTVHDYALVSANYALWNGERALGPHEMGVFGVAGTRFMKGSWLATLTLELITRLQRQLRLYDKYVTRYIAPSAFVQRALCAAGYPEEKIVVRAPLCEAPEVVVRKSAGYVLFVGRLERYKGVQVVIDVARLLPKRKFVVVGEGPERRALEGQGLPNVEFRGYLAGDALAAAYAGAEALVVPSLWHEPFGLVAVEGMLRGVPVLVSRRGGLPEIVEEGKSGVVFEPTRPAELAAYLQHIPEDLGQKGRQRAQELCDPVAHMRFIDGLYEEAVDNFLG